MARLGARLFYPTLAVLAACLACHPIFESDPYWHMSLGREVLRQGTRVVTETLAHPSFPATCVVAEWLWDVALYGLHALLGEAGVVACAMSCAALFVLTLKGMLKEGGGLVAQALLATLVLATCVWRFEARPELAALVILPLFLSLRDRFAASAEEREQTRLLLALAVLTVLWAQLHGSFVLAPVLGLMAAGPALRARDRDALRMQGLLFALLLGACLTSAHGTSIASYILAHGAGDATRHITDMKSADLKTLAPFAPTAFGSLFLIWLMAILAVLRGRGSSADIASAALGVALFFDAHRFAGVAAILSAKLALAGIAELTVPVARRAYAALGVLSVLALATAGKALHELRGPLLHWQRDEVGHPTLASRWLRALPEGSSVLTDYVGGAEIGFWLDGHVRTFVDGRTPMYFDDTDLAISRDLELSVGGFERVRARYGFVAAVVSRHGYACKTLAQIWTPVVVEGLYTTFVPRSSAVTALPALAACGPEFFSPTPCAGDELSRAVRQLRRTTGDSAFARFLAATQQGVCGDASQGLRVLPQARELWPLRSHLRVARAQSALRAGEATIAEREISEVIESEPLMAMRISAMPEQGTLDLGLRRQLLEAMIAEMDDAAPAPLRARLAAICAEQNDVPCAYFQGIRSAIAGEHASLPVLKWLAENAADERIRSEAAAYRALLERLR